MGHWAGRSKLGLAEPFSGGKFSLLGENRGCSVDLGLEQEKLVPACAVIEIEGEAGLVGIEGKLVSEESLEGTLMGFDDWFYDSKESWL